MHGEMIILHDSPSGDLSHIDALANMSEGMALFDYVSIAEKGGQNRWAGQIVETNRNISTVGDRVSPVILHGLGLMQTHDNVKSVESVQIYRIWIMGLYEDGALTTPRVRPLPGAIVEKLGEADTLQMLNLPKKKDGNVIGVVSNADNIPITVRKSVFNHHIMVAGGTGSGKSNVAANLVAQAVKMGKCVIIHDAKPDYRKINDKNTDESAAVKRSWGLAEKYEIRAHAAENVCKLGFYGYKYGNTVSHCVKLKLDDFSNGVLAAIFFPDKRDEPQFETFLDTLEKMPKDKLTLGEVAKRIKGRISSENPAEALHKLNANAVIRKIDMRKKRMPWLESDAPSMEVMESPGLDGMASVDQTGSTKTINGDDIDSLMKPGRIIVVDYSQMEQGDYALILSFFLRKVNKIRRDKKVSFGVVQLIDEAHRIFDNESSHSSSLENIFSRIMWEGRVWDHSIILSLQSASLIPPRVMTNLNTRFIMRQNSRYDADRATEAMGKEFSIQSMRLGAGHSLVSMHESQAVVSARMFPSPYELMRTDN